MTNAQLLARARYQRTEPLRSLLRPAFRREREIAPDPAADGPRFRLPERMPVGAGQHRSGWPDAVAGLRRLAATEGAATGGFSGGVLLDDFVERTFCYGRDRGQWSEPWIGIFHHPPDMPAMASAGHRPQEYLRSPAFVRSRPHLVRGIALSDYLARWLRTALELPVDVIRHPTATPSRLWSASACLAERPLTLLQVGWYLRNVRGIHQVPAVPGVRRCRTALADRSAADWDGQVRRYWTVRGDRSESPGVEEWPRLNNAEYDAALARSVVLAEFFDASANNLIIECLVRNTPLVCNPHPAVVEHLGADYPLYFRHPEEVPGLLSAKRIIAAHDHLARLDKRCHGLDSFVEAIRRTVAQAGGTP